MFRKTIRTAAFAIAAAAVCLMSQDATAQVCPYGGGYGGGFNRGVGGSSFNLSIGRTNGFGGFNNGFGGSGFNSFGRSSSAFRGYGSSRYVPSRSYGGFNSFGRSGFRY